MPDVSIEAYIPQPKKEIKYLIDMTKQYHNMLEREIKTKNTECIGKIEKSGIQDIGTDISIYPADRPSFGTEM